MTQPTHNAAVAKNCKPEIEAATVPQSAAAKKVARAAISSFAAMFLLLAISLLYPKPKAMQALFQIKLDFI